MTKIANNWWKDFFNDVYLTTDARSVCNASLTRKETNLLEETLDLKKNDRILDLCGGEGRHSMELARRGYADLTVLDYSTYLINSGKAAAKKSGLRIRFIKGDARFTKLKKEDYSAVIVMANSFGYFPEEKHNFKILKEIYRLLKKNGRALLDLTDPDYLRKNLKSVSWHNADKDTVVCRVRQLEKDLIKAREIVISRKSGLLRDGFYCERIYPRKKLISLLKNAGFKNISIKKGVSLHGKKQDYGFLTSRMFVTAIKS